MDGQPLGETSWGALLRTERDAAEVAHRLRSALAFFAEVASDWERGTRCSPPAFRSLRAYRTPGNELKKVIRELKGVMLDAAANAPRLRRPPRGVAPATDEPAAASAPPALAEETLSDARDKAERSKLLEALGAHGGNRVRAAQQLGISRAGLYRLLDKCGVG